VTEEGTQRNKRRHGEKKEKLLSRGWEALAFTGHVHMSFTGIASSTTGGYISLESL